MCLVTNIQKYSIHDGDGIRTTVFFKGCPLRCAWCHNPETQKWKHQILTNQEKCTGCMECERVCPNGAVRMENGKAVTDYEKCTGCGECVTACLSNIREVAGKEYTIKELLKELKKDEMFYEESGGGVTLSGGAVGGLLISLSQALGKQGVDAHADAHGKADQQILDGEGQGQRRHRAFRHLGNVDAVHHVVKRLHQHGDDQGQRHVGDQFPDGHNAHFVFL